MSIRVQALGGILVLGLAGCTASGEAPAAYVPATPAEAARACAGLAQATAAALAEPTARIVSAKLNAATATMPDHCEVLGLMRERAGAHGQRYAVKFRLRLPTAWNGRFLFQGGGGTNGTLGTTTGYAVPGGGNNLTQGYAIVTTDTGHDNAVNSDPTRQGAVAFAHDYTARVEYAESALDSVAATGKAIVRLYYSRPARKSYFAGCSNGGREALIFANRYPDRFDGVVATAPAMILTKAVLASTWDTQTFADLARKQGLTRASGGPDLARTFTESDLKLVVEAAAKTCDADDGLADGILQDVTRCTTARVRPALEAQRCTGAKAATCLSGDQIAALVRVMEGPRNSRGEPLYSDWAWDLGMANAGWRVWKTGVAAGSDPVNVTLVSPAVSAFFTTPPVTVSSLGEGNLNYMLGFDLDRDPQKFQATTREFPRSSFDLLVVDSTNLERFRRSGGKIILPHGGSDPIFSVNDSVRWWQRLDAARGGRAADFARVYPVPGMTHCSGGPATDQYDPLAALVAWVEEGKAPDRIEARAGPASPWPGRTRPLCPFPAIARYKSGDTEKSESFTCERPKA